MFVGHGLVAFALLVAIGKRAGWQRERTLQLAVLAAVFATLPDVDILYALVGLLDAHSGALAAASAFWQTGNVVHRALTHSVVVAPVVALAAGLWTLGTARQSRLTARLGRGGAVALLAGLVLLTTSLTGGQAGLIMTVFALGALAIAHAASQRGINPTAVGGVALVALFSHPFGDVFTGEPPAVLYPFDVTLLTERVTLHPDPTLHLLSAFFLELGVIWLAVTAYHGLQGRRLRESLSPRATVGLGYAAAAFAVPAPTLDSSYQFVFTALAVGVVGPVRFTLRRGPRSEPAAADGGRLESVPSRLGLSDPLTAIVTGLTAVTLAGLAYTLVYLLV